MSAEVALKTSTYSLLVSTPLGSAMSSVTTKSPARTRQGLPVDDGSGLQANANCAEANAATRRRFNLGVERMRFPSTAGTAGYVEINSACFFPSQSATALKIGARAV